MKGKQAVVESTLGTFVIELLPDLAPNHVAYVMKLTREGAYDGTTFHRAISHGIIQGGDPLSKDPAKAAQYGTGGLGVLDGETILPGEWEKAKKLIAEGKDINYEGASGSQEFDEAGDVPGVVIETVIEGKGFKDVGPVALK